MAFWSAWFKPKCDACGQKIAAEPIHVQDRKLCGACHDQHLAEQARAAAEIESRRVAEEEARRKLEERKTFGPRT